VDVRIIAVGGWFRRSNGYSLDLGNSLSLKSVWVDKTFETEEEAREAGSGAGRAAIDGLVAGA